MSKLLLIDSNSIIHRAFHALPPLKKKDGEQVNAVYGFLLILLRAIKDFQPDYIIAAFDLPKPTFRHKKFKDYKAKRVAAPDELYSQIPMVKDFLRLLKIPTIEKAGFEADDIIGTVSREFPKKERKAETIILSGDMDVLQLVNENTMVFAPQKGVKDAVLYKQDQVKEKFDLFPSQIIDYKGLRGDPSDNIPGVSGIGEKTAVFLLKEFKTLKNIYKNINSKKISERINNLLKDQKDQAFLSAELARISLKVPLKIDIKECSWGKYNKEKILKELENYEFFSLKKRMQEIMGEKGVGENLKLW